MKCHQRIIRDKIMRDEPRPVQESLDGCGVHPITRAQAASIILEYEWLGTMPKVGLAYYGLISPTGELLGASCFGTGSGTNAANVCGPEHKHLAVCLERGACVPWAHPHAASFQTAASCKQAHKDHGWSIFYGYSDSEAGEIGTIYQACN